MPRPPSFAALAELKAVVGTGSWFDSPEDLAPYLCDFRRLYHGASPLVLLPRSVEEVAKLMAICHRDEARRGAARRQHQLLRRRHPDESGTQIVLSLQRLNRVRHLDAANYSMTIEVGCTLAAAQAAARDANRLFPLVWAPRARRRLAATSRPMPAARRYCATE